jgi:surfeit locus 1 family protein
MRFRPLPAFTAASIVMLGVLLGLGFWQLQRLHWKLGLIAEMNAHLAARPLPLDAMLALPAADREYRRVALAGHFDNGREAFVYATGMDGTPVYHVIAPVILADGRSLLVDRGVIPLALKPPALRLSGQLAGEQHVVGVWRTPDPPGWFTGTPDHRRRVWYARDLKDIGHTLAVSPAAPVIVEADAAPVPGGWPRGGQTVIALRNDHLQYAITWFLLAGALVVVYFAYHRAQGRVG